MEALTLMVVLVTTSHSESLPSKASGSIRTFVHVEIYSSKVRIILCTSLDSGTYKHCIYGVEKIPHHNNNSFSLNYQPG